jgi:carboxymethylenebutenolidase
VDQKIINLYDKYTHGGMNRRDFLGKLSSLAGGVAAASAILPVLENNYARAALVSPTDSRINAGMVEFPGETGQVRGYMSHPMSSQKLPGVVVIHENRGLNPHIEDVTRRIALEGFLALAPDALSPFGGTPADQDEARSLIGELNPDATLKNYLAAVKFLGEHAQCTGKVGCVGFCWGGAMANQLAVNSPDLLAAVPYYGRQPDAGDVPRIGAALLLQYAGLDERINSGIEDYEKALKTAGKDYQIFVYEGVNHAFNNDTNAARYDKQAAELAWGRTIAFLKDKLK